MEQLKQRYSYAVILLKELVKTDFKLRYQGSVLGYLWSLLRPLALFLILYIVFAKFLKIGEAIPDYPVYLLLGIVLWSYFTEVTSSSVGSIVGRGDLLRKLNFPKYVIVLSGSFSALINLGINTLVIGFFMVISKVEVSPLAILVPLLLIELFVLALALAFFLSALYVRFRDIAHIWEVVIQGAFYATPILYPLSLVPPKAAKILMLNPMAQIIQDMRYLVVTQQTTTIDDLYGTHFIRVMPVGIIIIILVLSTSFFRRRSKYFAEEL
ncbi:MAG: ABC transporter permease [Patescibacteria group bacterium]